MNRIAAIRTGPTGHVAATVPRLGRGCSFVEDLNWPAPEPAPQRKTPRPTELWAPGPLDSWEGVTPTLH